MQHARGLHVDQMLVAGALLGNISAPTARHPWPRACPAERQPGICQARLLSLAVRDQNILVRIKTTQRRKTYVC